MEDQTDLNQILREKLDSFALNIEFLLISVVQGVAVGALATAASTPLATLQWEFWPYIVASFLVILTYWSETIVHTISFIDWPLDLMHSFLYFLTSFIEVVAFTHITEPIAYFGFMTAFFAVAIYLYWFDLKLIKQRKPKFMVTEKKTRLYNDIVYRQTLSLKLIMPAAGLLSLVAFVSLAFFPNIFINHHYQLIFISIQVVINFIILHKSIQNFKTRANLIAQSA